MLFCALLLSLFLVACHKEKETGTKGTMSWTISLVGNAIAVQAFDEQNFAYSATPDANGAFKFYDLSVGTYRVSAVPGSGFNTTAGTSVMATAGHDVNTGTLLLYPF